MPIFIILVDLHIYNFPSLSHFPQHHPPDPLPTHTKTTLVLFPPNWEYQITPNLTQNMRPQSPGIRGGRCQGNQRMFLSISFQLPLLPELCASRSPSALQLLLPPLSSSAPPSSPSISSRCSMYVSVCEPAEPPVRLHVRRSALLDLPHLRRRGAFLKCPSEKEFS